MDSAKLRREIQQQYPSAKIVGLDEKPLIRVIKNKKLGSNENEQETTKGT